MNAHHFDRHDSRFAIRNLVEHLLFLAVFIFMPLLASLMMSSAITTHFGWDDATSGALFVRLACALLCIGIANSANIIRSETSD